MPMTFFSVPLCSFLLVGGIYAQEVIVTREPKPEAPKQLPTPPPEQTPSETATPEPERLKPKSRAKKSTSEEPTLEEMRMAGAHAAEKLNNPSPSRSTRSSQSGSEVAPTPSPVVLQTSRPAKRESRSEQPRVSRSPSVRTTRPDAAGVVRPTMMESGREQASPSLSPKEQTP